MPVKNKRSAVKSKYNTKIRKNDTVYVVAGKEKGRTGNVIKVLRDENKVLVEKINKPLRFKSEYILSKIFFR